MIDVPENVCSLSFLWTNFRYCHIIFAKPEFKVVYITLQAEDQYEEINANESIQMGQHEQVNTNHMYINTKLIYNK